MRHQAFHGQPQSETLRRRLDRLRQVSPRHRQLDQRLIAVQLLAQRLELLDARVAHRGSASRPPGPPSSAAGKAARGPTARAGGARFVPDSRPRSLGCREAQPLLHGGDDLGARRCPGRSAAARRPPPCPRCQYGTRNVTRSHQSGSRSRASRPSGAWEASHARADRALLRLRPADHPGQMPDSDSRAGDLQAQRGTFGHSQRWDRTGDGSPPGN